MSSSVNNSLSPGAQLLANNRLPSNLSQSDKAGAAPDQLAKTAGTKAVSPATSTLFGEDASAGGDSVVFSPEAMHLLQQMGDLGHSAATSSPALTAYSVNSAYESFDLLG